MKREKRPGRWKRRSLRTLATLAIFYVLGCAGIWQFQEWVMFHPRKLEKSYVFSFPEKFSEVWLEPGINALYFTLPEPRGVVLYLHGNSGCIEEGAGIRNEFLSRGYEFFTPDYPEFGKSEGKLSEQALFDVAMNSFIYLSEKFRPENIMVYGHSMGTGPSVWLASKVTPGRLFLEAPYSSGLSMAKQYPLLPVKLLMRYPLLSSRYAAQVSCETHIFHGTADGTIPYEQGKDLSLNFSEGIAKLHTIEGGGHNDLPQYALYQSVMDEALGSR